MVIFHSYVSLPEGSIIPLIINPLFRFDTPSSCSLGDVFSPLAPKCHPFPRLQENADGDENETSEGLEKNPAGTSTCETGRSSLNGGPIGGFSRHV